MASDKMKSFTMSDSATIAGQIGAAGEELALVQELEQLSLEAIKLRGPQLDAHKAALQAQLLELASGATGTFIENADNLRAVHADVRTLSEHLAALEGHLPRAAARAEKLQADARESIAARERNSALLSKHAEVQELLEQPQLMDTLVRNGLVDEALELEAAARSRAIVHADVPAVAHVAVGVSAHMPALRASLLAQLAGPLQLPDALRVVSCLRRMGRHALGEPQLRMAFLRNRTLCMAQAEAALPREPPHAFLLKYVDLCRVHWYDTVTHYRALFAPEADDEAAAPPLTARGRVAGTASRGASASAPRRPLAVECPTGAQPGDSLVACDADGVAHMVSVPPNASAGVPFEVMVPYAKDGWGDACNEFAPGTLAQADSLASLLLSSWAAERVDELLQTLGAWLPKVREGDFLAYVIEQTGHCARALGRVGLDVAALARAPFREAVLRILDDGLEAATAHWGDALAAHRWNAPHASAAAIAALSPAQAADTAAAPTAEVAKGQAGGGGRMVSSSPPLALLQHPPVAVLLNHLLTVFNELRTCAPYELRHALFARVQAALLACVSALADVDASGSEKGGAGIVGEQARAHYRSLCACMAEHLVPHVARCLDQLVPAWEPPPELQPGGGVAATDDVVNPLITVVVAALRPLHAPEAAPEAAPTPAPDADVATDVAKAAQPPPPRVPLPLPTVPPQKAQ